MKAKDNNKKDERTLYQVSGALSGSRPKNRDNKQNN